MVLIEKFREFRSKYERWMPIAFFVAGFLFDMSVLHRIDEPAVLVQQALYLVVSGALISVELFGSVREITPPAILAKVWGYRDFLLHFLLGTLLNSFTIFYFKSASGIAPLLFIATLAALLIVNEFLHFGKFQTQVHFAFLSLCLISYLTSLSPILLGFMGDIPFLGSLASSFFVFYLYYRYLRPRLAEDPGKLKRELIYPYAAVHAVFALLYFTHVIPPVPLSISYMGVYHNIEKKDGGYELTYMRPKWRFWEHGDQTFLARPGDTVFCFAQIFSPTGFKDELQVRWLYREEKRGWQSSDAIPMAVTGGREEGYRVITKKKNFQPGDWRVQVETRDNREIGRIGFTIVPDSGTDPRQEKKHFQ